MFIGAGAMVIGNIRIGDDLIIGANTMVVQDIPAGCRVVSAAVRILPPRSRSELAIAALAGAESVDQELEPRASMQRSDQDVQAA